VRKILPFITMLLLAGCDMPNQWEKPGVERAALDSDTLHCRHVGTQEALRAYSDLLTFPFSSPPFFAGSWRPPRELASRSVEADRTRAEIWFTADCMRGKSYERTPSKA
jgi:hypothetical protein